MNNKKVIRIVAIVLVALLVGGVVFGALVSALSESASPGGLDRDQYHISMEYLEYEQALHVEQRLVYINRTSETLDRVVFYAAANMFRRQSALMYESDDLPAVFPSGFAPGGIDLREVRVNGEAADYGFQGESEIYLRVACALAPGERAEFEFDYYLIVPDGDAFIGAGETDVRLSAFYFIPGVYDDYLREFIVNKPLPFTRWLFSETGDYEVEFTCATSKGYDVASVGQIERESRGVEGEGWRIAAQGVREFALSFSKRWREKRVTRADGADVIVYAASREAGRVASVAVRALDQCESWFGILPYGTIAVVQADSPLDAMSFPGYIQLPSRLFEKANEDELESQLRFAIAQQYFGHAAYTEPSADAWLSDSVCTYIACLLLEAEKGHDAFLRVLNRDLVSVLQLTIPGGLTVTSDATLFDAYEYGVVVKSRGAVVMHELRQAMGLETMLDGLRRFFEMGVQSGATGATSANGAVLTEMDFVACMDAASGYDGVERSWEAFLTDWVFNVGDYVNQSIDWFE